LNETELGQPFGDLQAIFAPLDELLSNLPGSNEELMTRLLDAGRTAETQEVNAQASTD
jgi:hypothetical protein